MRLQIPTRRAIGTIAALLMLTCVTSVEAATFGRTTIGTTPSGGLRPDYKRGSSFTLTQTGTLKKLCAYLDGRGTVEGATDYQMFRLSLYRDLNGVPTTKVAEALRDDGLVLENTGPSWACEDTALVPLSPGKYWIVIHSGGVSSPGGLGSVPNIIRYYYDGTGNWYGNADALIDGASFSFGAGSAGDGTMSAYAVFDTPAELGIAGKTSIGATPSAGLRSNFKRGSGFTLPEAARVTAISVYLDGLAGGTDGGDVANAVIYQDKNGVPDALVSGGDKFVSFNPQVLHGASPRWITWEATVPVDLAAGKYWLILHTDNWPAPVARYYFDGTGNWYGNADSFYDGPSNPFGAGSAGDGTISAFVSYKRGPFVTQTFGRTTVASEALKPLTANYFRGGYFQAPGEYKWLTATYAYLDGLGGASGSQKMKMALDNGYDTVIATTDEVAIPAGMMPRWVRFPMNPPIRLKEDIFAPSPGYYLFLHTGDTGGVARAYGDGPNNWYGAPWTYPWELRLFDPDTGSPLQKGTRTLSMYGELSVPPQ